MTSTLSVILMEIVQKAMEAQNLSTTPRVTTAPVTTTSATTTFATTMATGTYGGGGPNDNRMKGHAPINRCPNKENWTTNDIQDFVGCHNFTDNETGLHGVVPRAMSYWALALLLIPTFTLFGNLLVIISVVKCRSLHSPINYFILGLAIADMCVAMAVMPFAVYVEFNDNWELGTLLCDLYCAADVTCSTASIFLLTVISFDRYVAATQPIRYANSAKGIGRVAAINLAVWLVSMLIASPMVLGLNNVPERDESKCMFYNADFIIYSSTGSFCIPLVIIIYLYGRIYCVIRERSRFAQQRRHILGTASRFSVGNVPEKSVVICTVDRNNVSHTVAPTAAAVSTASKGNETALEKEKLLDLANAMDGVAKENGGRRRSKSLEPIAARGLATALTGTNKNSKPDQAPAVSNAGGCTAAEKRKKRFARSSTQTCSSSLASTADRRYSSRFSIRTARSDSVSSSTSSCSSTTTKDDADVCDYSPHIDLIRHLQKTSHALASRHRRIPDGKRKSFLFTGACNSFFRNVSGVASSDMAGTAGSKRFSWHPSSASTSTTTGRCSSQAQASETSSVRPDSVTPPPQTSVNPFHIYYARSKSVSTTGESNHAIAVKPSLSATVSLNPSIASGNQRAQSASPTIPDSVRRVPQLRLHPPPSLTRSLNQRYFSNHSGSLCVDPSYEGLYLVNEHDHSDHTLASIDHDDHTSVDSSLTSTLCRNSVMSRNYETFKPFGMNETIIPAGSKNVPRRNTVSPCVADGPEGQKNLRIIENLTVTKLADDSSHNEILRSSQSKLNGMVPNGSEYAMNGSVPKPASARPSVEQTEATQGDMASSPLRNQLIHCSLTDPDSAQARWYRRLSTRLSVWRRRRECSFANGTATPSKVVMDANKTVAVAATVVASSRAQPSGEAPATIQPQAPKQTKALKKVTKSQRKEKKATKTLAIVLGIFLICWLPFFTLNLLNAVCIKLGIASCQVGFLPFFLTTWLGYMNSLMNPIIYTIFNMDFRRAFKQILCPCFVKQRTRRV